jgi:hypothetical protein
MAAPVIVAYVVYKLPHCESPMWRSAVVLEDDGIQYPIFRQLLEYKLLEHV